MLCIFVWCYLCIVVRAYEMSSRPAKLARVQALRVNIPYVSQSALAVLLKELEREPMPACNRQAIRDARNDAVRTHTPYGPLHQTIKVDLHEGDTVDIEIQHPFAMLYNTCRQSDVFSEFMSRVAAAHPSTVSRPWQLIIYTDEILPGNQLAHKSARKSWAVYWSIMQFGMSVLSDEAPGVCDVRLHIRFVCLCKWRLDYVHPPLAYTHILDVFGHVHIP